MRSLAAVIVALLVAATPVSLAGWGLDVHRFLTRRALDGLPPEMKPFYAAQRDFIVEHSVDPDMWRTVSLKSERGEEDPNHFLDIDGLDDPAPFKGVPRDWTAYVDKYGAERATRAGRLPWRAEDIYKLLVARFQDVGKGGPAYAADNARYLSAVLAHYVEDGHQPLHAVANYDGQMTNQRGVHSRFESELVLRNLSTMTLTPVAIRPIANFRDFMFETVIASQGLSGAVLAADRKATEGLEFYDDAYYAAFFKGARRLLEQRLSETASGVASAIVAAWTEAGKPALPVAKPVAPVRIRR